MNLILKRRVWSITSSNEDINKIRKILTYRKKENLALLLQHSRSVIKQSNSFGSYYNSILCTFEIYSPIQQNDKFLNLTDEEKNEILKAILEIYPNKDNSVEITDVEFYLDINAIDVILPEVETRALSNSNNDFNNLLGFLSYSHEDRFIAGDIKKQLKAYGFDTFLAHEDIEPTIPWEKEIHEKLKKCDIFIPLVSSNFKNSNWTDQETGIAYGYDKFIIPVSVDKAPYGFINKIQALKHKDSVIDTSKKILSIIMSSHLSEKYKNSLINSYIDSQQYSDANEKYEYLVKCEPYTELQVNKILFGFLVNIQVTESFSGKRIINNILNNYPELIYPELKNVYERFKNNKYFPVEPYYDNKLLIKDIYINKIIKDNKNLTKQKVTDLIDKESEKQEGNQLLFDAIVKIASKNNVLLLKKSTK